MYYIDIINIKEENKNNQVFKLKSFEKKIIFTQ